MSSLRINCVLILNKEKTSFIPKKLQNNFIPVTMGTRCYFGPSKSKIPIKLATTCNKIEQQQFAKK